MKPFYFIIIAVIVVGLGMLFFPTVHLIVNAVNTTGFLPLTAAATTFLAYAFLGFIVYAIFQAARR